MKPCFSCGQYHGQSWRVLIQVAKKPKGAHKRWEDFAIRCDTGECREGSVRKLKEQFGENLGGFEWRGIQ